MFITSVKEIWKKAWSSPVTRRQLILIFILIPLFVFGLPHFFVYVQARQGVVLNDWVLALIPPHNVSTPLFAVIWGMMALIFYRALFKPSIWVNYLLSLAVVNVARVICISLVPLDPPVGLIPIIDRLTGVFYGEAPITKDLFFSGHTATVMLIFLCLEKKTDRKIGFVAVVTIICLLLVQHLHYTIDVMAAPIIVYGCYRLTRYLLGRWELLIRTKGRRLMLKNNEPEINVRSTRIKNRQPRIKGRQSGIRM